MSKNRILLICACGSSILILMQNMQQNLKDDEDWTIDALSVSEGKKYLANMILYCLHNK